MMIGDFKCGSDGTAFLPLLENAAQINARSHGELNPHSRLLFLLDLTALTPSGSLIRFTHGDMPGLRNFLPTLRYFVSSSRVYVLEYAEVYDPADSAKTLGRAYFILIYDYKGEFKGYVRLDPGLYPINIAAFPSGDILVVSLDQLNQTTRLMIVDEAGRPVKELKLFDEDYGLQLQRGEKGKTPHAVMESIQMQLALSKWVPFGDDLLMAPSLANLPLIEINENGVVRSINVTLPDHESRITGVITSNDGIYHVVASTPDPIKPSASNPPGQKVGYFATEIDNIYPGDGSILSRAKFAHGLNPVCIDGDSYMFVSTRAEDGKLQTIRGTVIH